MASVGVLDRPPARRFAGWRMAMGLTVAMLAAVTFVAVAAVRYLTLDPQIFGQYWPRRWWLVLHIGGGMVALLTGPGQLWLGLARLRLNIHRQLGLVYMASVGLSSIGAFYLATHSDGGWVFASGLFGLGVAWIITTSLAFVAIRRGLIDQHKEWMIRSYVVTFAFVTFRILLTALQAGKVGTLFEQLAISAWFCWSVPLLITEAVLQSRKILAGIRG